MPRTYPRQTINLKASSFLLAFRGILSSGSTEREWLRQFELKFSRKIGTTETIPISSARFGLALLLEELGAKPGDEVIFPTYTYHAMPNIIAALKLRPVFVDIRENDFNMDPECVEQAITRKTKAIIATHIYGQPAEMKALCEIADDKELFLIEDCAEATGAEYRGKPVGSFGDTGLFSFSMGKPLVGLGGGAITTSNQELADAIRARIAGFPFPSRRALLKAALSYAHIWLSSHPNTFWCTTYPLLRLANIADSDIIDSVLSKTRRKELRMHEIPESTRKQFSDSHARVLLNELTSLDEMNRRRIEIAETYNKVFRESEKIGIAELSPRNKNIYNAYGVRLSGYDLRDVQRHLIRRGIDTKQRHMYVCSALEMFREFRTSCPVAERVAGELLHLPISHYMSGEDARYIAECVLNLFTLT